jgi:predicted  nucleic acid-binding Zn-ribbon protein
MTTAFAWTELKKLVVIDHEISEIQKIYKRAESKAKTIQSAHAALIEQKKAIEVAAHAIQKELNMLELSHKDLNAQLKKKQSFLLSAVHAKETVALEHEIATLQSNRTALDEKSMQLLEQQEILNQTLHSHTAHITQSLAAVSHATQELDLLKQSTDAAIAHRTTAWQEQLLNVPLELRDNYLNLRTRIQNPVVALNGQSCSGCCIELLAQDMHSLSTRTVIQCRGCYRFLFIPDATTSSLTASHS